MNKHDKGCVSSIYKYRIFAYVNLKKEAKPTRLKRKILNKIAISQCCGRNKPETQFDIMIAKIWSKLPKNNNNNKDNNSNTNINNDNESTKYILICIL